MAGWIKESAVLGQSLLALGARIASCESCTSGALADAITQSPGASAWLEVGLVCYSEAAKTKLSGVDPALFATCGVVSEEVAEAMARGVAKVAGCRFGVATTGLAGPGGAEGPRGCLLGGTVCMAVIDAQSGNKWVQTIVFEGDRSQVRDQATGCALAMASKLALDALTQAKPLSMGAGH